MSEMAITALPGIEASLLGESPLWHPVEHRLYWCDIAGHKLNCFDPATGAHRQWAFDTDVGCEEARLEFLEEGIVDPAAGQEVCNPGGAAIDPGAQAREKTAGFGGGVVVSSGHCGRDPAGKSDCSDCGVP